MFEHILIPTDGSPVANKAVKAGIELAKTLGARVTAYYAVEALQLMYVEGYAFDQKMIDGLERRAREARQKRVDVIRPDEAWMLQIGRNLLDAANGSLDSKRYLILYRDTKYSERFRGLVKESGIEVTRLPPRRPNLNAYAERFVRSIKQECLNRIIFVGQASLRRAIAQYMGHYHEERNHQCLDNRLIRAEPLIAANDALIHCRLRLGGMLNYYYRQAA